MSRARAILGLILWSGLALAAPDVTGRYQVVTTPGSDKTTVLVDTQTGRTWMLCVDEARVPGWCEMVRKDVDWKKSARKLSPEEAKALGLP